MPFQGFSILRYFNSTSILAWFVLLPLLLPVLLAISVLNPNKRLLLLAAGKSVTAPATFKAGSFLLYCYKLPDGSE